MESDSSFIAPTQEANSHISAGPSDIFESLGRVVGNADDSIPQFVPYGSDGFVPETQFVEETQALCPDSRDASRQLSVSERIKKIQASNSSAQPQPPNHLPTATANSLGSGKVLIIRPNDPNSREMIKQPVKFSRAIRDSPFSKFPIKDVRTNQIRNHTVIEYIEITRPDMEKLLEVKKLGQWDVRCSMPNSDRLKFGVIRPIDVDEDLEDIREVIQIKLGSNQPLTSTTVQRIERLSRKSGEGWVPSESIKITFCAEVLPEGVTIGHTLYRVRPYIGEPLQCYRCNLLGHTAAGCKGKQKCNLCGKDHKQADCPIKGRTAEYFCTNCKGNHKSNSNDCPIYKNAKDIESVRAKQNKTLAEARFIVMGGHRGPSAGFPIDAGVQGRTYSSVLTASQRTVSSREVSTQTERVPNSGNFLGLEVISDTAKFIQSLKVCLLEIFQTNVFAGDPKSRSLSIEKAVDRSFLYSGTGGEAKPGNKELDWSNCSDDGGVLSSPEDDTVVDHPASSSLQMGSGPDHVDAPCTVVGIKDYLAETVPPVQSPPFVDISQSRKNKRKAQQNSLDSKNNKKKGKTNTSR